MAALSAWIRGEYLCLGTALTSVAMTGDQQIAMIFDHCIPKTGNWSKVHFRTGNLNVEDAELRIAFYTVDGSGNPGTEQAWRNLTASSTNDDDEQLSTGILSDDGSDTGVKFAVTKGGSAAVVWSFQASDAANFTLAAVQSGATNTPVGGGIYASQQTAASWTKSTTLLHMVVIEYDDGTCAEIPFSCGWGTSGATTAWDSVTFNSTTTPDEIGMKFRFEVETGIDAFIVYSDADADYELVVYDSDGTTALFTIAKDKDIRSGTSGRGIPFILPSTMTCLANTDYRVVVKPGASTVGIRMMTVGAAFHWNQMPMGSAWKRTERTDAGSWSDTDTQCPLIAVHVVSVDIGSDTPSPGLIESGFIR